MNAIDEFLTHMITRGASDLHMTATLPPYLREHGDMTPIAGCEPLSPGQCKELLYEIMPDRNRAAIEEDWDTDFSYEISGVGRFRANIFRDRLGLGAVFRVIPTKIPTADDLGLPKTVRDFCYLPKGLVVVTGPTGSGKSTTLAAMLDLINKTRTDHIITVEDPVEFVHTSQKCLVNQREVHVHTRSFANALRAALREDPDIVMLGEMRDLETMEIAVETAETGHLVFGTLHTNTAASTVERIIDKFPTARQNQIRAMLASSLKGVIAQTLCRKKGGRGRVAAMEILVSTSGVASNIRDGKTHQIASAMQTGRALGMQLMDDVLMELIVSDKITVREGYFRSTDKDAFAKKLAAADLPMETEEGPITPPAGSVKPKPADAHLQQLAQAIKLSLDTLRRDPDNLEALNNLAWIYATSTDTDSRRSSEAVRMAEKACSLVEGEHPGLLDTLGAAYAGHGQFAKAVASARRGLELARELGDTALAEALQQRLNLYEAGKAHRE